LRARSWLLPALVDEYEEVLIARLRAGSAQLWLGERSAMVTEIVGPPREIHVWLAGGDLQELVSFTAGIAAFGRSMGCVTATLEGRRGWARALKQYGFRGEGLMRKALT